MSQNKTVIPESEYDFQSTPYADFGGGSDFYRPSGSEIKRTVIAGTELSDGNATAPVDASAGHSVSHLVENGRTLTLQDRSVVGVLFSISRGVLGEIFPIYLGRNMIGAAPDSDIRLGEKTVSDDHAVIFARSEGYPGEYHLTISDYGSCYGTVVNKEDCRYNTVTLVDGDIISIGKHYRLLFRIFDVEKKGLFEDTEFEDKDSSSSADADGQMESYTPDDFYSPTPKENYGANTDRTVIG